MESRIEYIPFEKKYVEYDKVERVERIPYEREIVEYEEVVHNERIPVERTITDYYAVETQVEYIPKEIEETIVEYEPVEKTWERVQYLPVETQIVHYPEREKYVAGQGGKYIQAGQVTRTETVQQPVSTTYQTSNYPVQQTYATGANTYSSTYNTGGSGVHQTTSYVNQPVSSTYTTTNVVGGGSGVRSSNYATNQGTTYVTQQPGTVEYATSQPMSYTTTEYVNQPVTTTTYNTTEYVNQPGTTTYTTNYNQGGSGYVSSGSGVRNATYETTNVNKIY